MIQASEHQVQQSQRIAAWSRAMVLAIIVALLALVARVAQLKVMPDPRLMEAAGTATSSHSELGRRGDLVDSRGRMIATSTVAYRLFVDPQTIKDPATISIDLAKAIGGSAVEIDRKIAARPDSRYVVIDDLLNEGQVEAVRDAKLRGVGLEPRLVRNYVHEDISALLIGFVGFEHTGLSGFEHAFDEHLEPTQGSLSYLRDVSRRGLWIQPSGYRPAENGESVQLSIDLVIQEIADRHLREAVKKNNACGGRAVVVDPLSGEILAMCDVLNVRRGWDEPIVDEPRRKNPALGRNRCVTDPYEPGSTFKPFIWAVATELGKARPSEVLPCPEHTGWRSSSGRLIRDAHYYGPSSWSTVLVKSINAGMAMVAERMTNAQMQDAVARFGFGTKTNCGVAGESAGIVTTPKKWTKYTQLSVSFGHEVSVTSVQLARAFCVFARDGTMPTLRITKEAQPRQEYLFEQRVLKPETVELTRQVMRDVMLKGTGRTSQSTKYQLFGKSGTPQLQRKDGKGYYQDRYSSNFIAGAPLENPRLVVLCIIDDPDRRIAHYGGTVAGPVVRDIMDEALAYLGVPPDMPQDEETTLAAAE